MSEAFSRDEHTARFKALLREEREDAPVHELGDHRTDSYIIPSSVLVDSESWAEIDDALIGESEVDGFNLALATHEASGAHRALLLARSDTHGVVLVDDRPLGSEEDHVIAEALARDAIEVLEALGRPDGELLMISGSIAYQCVIHGIWISIGTLPTEQIGAARAAVESLRVVGQ